MTNTEINIAIANLCGWTDIHNSNTIVLGGVWKGFHQKYAPIITEPQKIPDYCGDLNAIHEAEKTLNSWDRARFQKYLGEMFPRDEDGDFIGWEGMFRQAIHATAAQRAEALLRSIGEWKE